MGVLTPNQVLFYIADTSDGQGNAVDPYKGGQTYRPGLTLAEAFAERYSDHSNRHTPITAAGFYVINTDKGIPQSGANRQGFAYDEYIRAEIIKAYRAGRIPFSAVVHATSGNGNSERLLNFNPGTDLDILADIVKQTQGLLKRRDVRPFRVWRFGQVDVIDDLYRILQSDGLCLGAVYTGGGKTVMAVEAVTRVLEPTGGLVLVLTPVSDTKNGFRDAIEGPYAVGLDRDVTKTFIDGKHLDRYDIAALRARADKGEVIFIVANVQDARYDDGNGTLRDKYQPLVGLVDVIINDERHKEFNATLTASRLAELTAPYVLNLTATPYNVYSLFTREQVVARTLVWALTHRDKTYLPKPHIHCLDTPLSAVDPIFAEAYTAEEGFDPRKWFARENGLFLNAKALMKFATVAYDQLDSSRKNGCSLNGRCGLWKCPDGQNGDSASDYLPALAELLNSTPRDVFFIDSFTLESLAKSQNIGIGTCVERLLNEKGRVTVLTCEKFLTGTDIIPLDHIVLLDKMQSIANFEQLLGRICRVCPGKDQVWFYCAQPNMTLKVLLGQLAKAQAAVSSGVTEREVLACMPLTYYQNGWKTFSIEGILSSVQEHFLSRLRDRVPAMSIAKDLLDSMHLLQEAPEGNFKGASVNIDALTDDTGAKVAKSNTKPSKKLSGQIAKTLLTKWVECFQTFSQEMRPAAWMTDVYDIDALLRDKMLAEIFTAKNMKYIRRVLTTNEGLRCTFQSTLNEVRESFAGLSVEQALDSGVFLNTAQKVKQGLVFTPLELARNMVKCIRAKSPKRVLVVNANNGAFAFAVREKWPNAEIVCAETHSYYMSWLKRNGFTVVEWSEKMVGSFVPDVIVGNPPYQDGTGKSSNKLWKQIVEGSLKRLNSGGYMAFVTPPSWMSPGSLYDDMMAYDMQWVSLDVAKHFNVGSEFSVWVLRKQASNGTTEFVTPSGTLTVEHSKFPFLPSRIDRHSLSITKKLLASPQKFSFIANNENDTRKPHMSESESPSHRWCVEHTNSQTYWSNRKPAEYDVPKVMITRSGEPIPNYSDACGVSQIMYYLTVKNAAEGKRLVKVLSSKLYQVLLKDSNGVKGMWKYSGWNQLEILRSLPAVDCSIDWTDEMLYEHFKLTKDEIAYVEQYAK